jgi:hypothetical protein
VNMSRVKIAMVFTPLISYHNLFYFWICVENKNVCLKHNFVLNTSDYTKCAFGFQFI